MRFFDNVRQRRRGRRSRGQSLVELALILPVLMLLVAGTIDLGRIFYSQVTVANAAREGAIEAAMKPTSWVNGGACNKDTNRVMCRVINEAKGSFVSIAPADVSLVCDPACTKAIGNEVTVTVKGHFSLLTPLMAVFTGGQNVTFASTATAQIATPPAGGTASTPTPSPTPTPTPTPTPAPTATATAGPTATPTVAPTPTPTPTPTPCFAPKASFTVIPTGGFATKPSRPGTVFTFTDTSFNMTAGCSPVWSWSFGDGSGTSSLKNPTYVYAKQNTNPGFQVTLVVTNSLGNATHSVFIRVEN